MQLVTISNIQVTPLWYGITKTVTIGKCDKWSEKWKKVTSQLTNWHIYQVKNEIGVGAYQTGAKRNVKIGLHQVIRKMTQSEY